MSRSIPLLSSTAVLAGLALTSCGADAQGSAPADASSAVQTPAVSESPTGNPDTASLTALQDLSTAEEEPTGFNAGAFGPEWADVDGNGCDTFNDALAHYLQGITYSPRGDDFCTVWWGQLDDQYMDAINSTVVYGNNIQRRNDVVIEHTVSLEDAWASGASTWDNRRRLEFANDIDTLVPLSRQTSQERGGFDAAGWVPARSVAACDWVAAQVRVKTDYDLAVDPAERKAMEQALTGCDTTRSTHQSQENEQADATTHTGSEDSFVVGSDHAQAPEAQDWREPAEAFATAYADSHGGNQEAWLAGMKPYITDDLYENFTYTDMSYVIDDELESVESVEINSTTLTFRIHYAEAGSRSKALMELQPSGEWKISALGQEGADVE